MEGIGRGLGTAFIFFGVMVGVIVAVVMGLIWFFTSDDTIRTDKKIEPEIELVIKNNKVDTVYVYREP